MSVAKEIMGIRALKARHPEDVGTEHDFLPIYSVLNVSGLVVMWVHTDMVRRVALKLVPIEEFDLKADEYWCFTPTRENWKRFYRATRFFVKRVHAFPNDQRLGGKVHLEGERNETSPAFQIGMSELFGPAEKNNQ